MNKSLPVMGMVCMMLAFGAKAAQAQTLSLDGAIQSVATEFSPNMERGTSVAVIAIQADSAGMSNHLINGMIAALFDMRNLHGFEVASRGQIELLMAEHELNMYGWVDDASAVSIGRFAGVQYIITGTFVPFGDFYRFWAQLIEVETGLFRGISTVDVQNDTVVATLLGAAGRIAPTPQIPTHAQRQRDRRDPDRPRANWLSVEATSRGVGMRYKRGINDLFSIGVNGFYYFCTPFAGWVVPGEVGISAMARLFPGGFPFYLELGLGLFGEEELRFSLARTGFMATPAVGIILGGRRRGFFVNPFLSFPTVFSTEITHNRLIFGVGIGGAW